MISPVELKAKLAGPMSDIGFKLNRGAFYRFEEHRNCGVLLRTRKVASGLELALDFNIATGRLHKERDLPGYEISVEVDAAWVLAPHDRWSPPDWRAVRPVAWQIASQADIEPVCTKIVEFVRIYSPRFFAWMEISDLPGFSDPEWAG